MATNFNNYAQKYSEAFKAMREEYKKQIIGMDGLEVYKARADKAKEVLRHSIVDEADAARARATIASYEARLAAFQRDGKDCVLDFKDAMKRLGVKLRKEIAELDTFDPSAVNPVVVNMLTAGLLSARDVLQLCERYADNYSMKNILGRYAYSNIDNAQSEDDKKLYCAASNYRGSMTGDLLNKWEALEQWGSVCTAKIGEERRPGQDDPYSVMRAMDGWERYTDGLVEDF